MRSKRIPAEKQYRLIMECRQSGLTDHQWCVEHDIKPGTYYNWVKRLRQKGGMDLPASTGHSYRAPASQEVVRVDFHATDPLPYEHPVNVLPVAKGCVRKVVWICQRQPDAAIVHRKARKLSEWIFMILTRSHMNSH